MSWRRKFVEKVRQYKRRKSFRRPVWQESERDDDLKEAQRDLRDLRNS